MTSTVTSPVCGGHSAVEITEDVIALAVSLKSDVENTLSSEFETFEPVGMTTQVVAGTVYHVKINTGSDHVHARIFKPLPHTGAPATLQKAVGGFSAEDAIAPL
ncbi:hypothetical protein TrCOL_g2330 [Triparma columacea]|uniref:Cystatin domain-containing protein n=1 Tax=Triparma columacea TaxID=722753 RepID=A0A9W7L548_9STRA|nr:hypothetical protein TrCOL_g2330 [Triparma columacea]